MFKLALSNVQLMFKLALSNIHVGIKKIVQLIRLIDSKIQDDCEFFKIQIVPQKSSYFYTKLQ